MWAVINFANFLIVATSLRFGVARDGSPLVSHHSLGIERGSVEDDRREEVSTRMGSGGGSDYRGHWRQEEDRMGVSTGEKG